jgi:putative ABC transport system permease protein
VLFVAGIAGLTAAVLQDDVAWVLVGVCAATTVIGALVAAPLATRPVVRVIVWPFRRFGGVVGRLAGENSLRVPRRTANTASALMIGLALVAALSVVAASIRSSVSDLIADQLTSDYVLSAGGQSPVPAAVPRKAAGLPGVKSVATIAYLPMTIGGEGTSAAVSTGAGLEDNVKVDVLTGSLAAIDRGEVLVDETTAKEKGWSVGSTITAAAGTLTNQRLIVGGTFTDNQLIGSHYISGRALYTKALPASQQQDFIVLVKAEPGADQAALRSALTDLVKPYVIVSVENGDEYVNSAAEGINQILGLLYVLLALAIVIAVLGIVNTLALSVVERTREIGLLRAVGLQRGQLARMITIEAVATAVFGAVLGTALGLGLGTAMQHGLRTEGLDRLAIPWSTIVTVLVASAVVGVFAAVLPAIRAVRLNVLQAIATE